MTLADLQDKLLVLPPGESIALDADLLGDDIAGLIAACLDLEEGQALTIDEPFLYPTDKPTSIRGTATFLSVDEVEIEVLFGEEPDDQGQPQVSVQIRAPMPAGWSFGTSFPKLPPFLSFSSLNYGYRRSFLNYLSLASSTFMLTTHPFDDDETKLSYATGLNYAADLSLTDILEPLTLLVGNPKPLKISGLITNGKERGPFFLSAAFPLELGDESFDFKDPQLRFYSSLEEFEGGDDLPDAPVDPTAPAETPPEGPAPAEPAPEEPAPDDAGPSVSEAARASRVELAAELTIAKQPALLTAEFQLGATLDFIAIGANFVTETDPGLELPKLSDLADLTGGADLEGALPEGLDLGAPVIEEFRGGFGLAPHTLAYVGMTISTSDEWVVIPDILVVTELATRWLIESPLKAVGRRLSCEIEGALAIAGVSLDVYAKLPELFLLAKLSQGSTIPLGDLIRHFVSSAPEAPGMVISQLDLAANPRLRTFSLATTLDDAWAIPLGEQTLEIRQLAFALDYAPGSTNVMMAGALTIFEIDFAVAARLQRTRALAPPSPQPAQPNPAAGWKPPVRPPATNVWNFTGELDQGTPVVLEELVAKFDSSQTLPASLAGLAIRRLSFAVDTGADKRYGFGGAITWPIMFNDSEQITVSAALDIDSWVANGVRQRALSVGGKVSFDTIDIGFFQNLTVSALYTTRPLSQVLASPPGQPVASQTTSEIVFIITKGNFQILADATYGAGQDTILTLKLAGTFGEMLTFLAQMLDPSIEEFSLDPPWDELLSVRFDGFSLVINVTRREVALDYAINKDIAGILTVKSIRVQYARPKLASGLPDMTRKAELMVNVVISGLGSSNKPLGWNPMTQPAPGVPGKGSSVFDLSYLGIGQHVAISQESLGKLETVLQIIEALKLAMQPPADKTKNPLAKPQDGIATGPQQGQRADLVFDPNSGWLIGAQLSLLGAIDLSMIFNDPLVYGLRLGLHGSLVQQLAGLEFEILYRRISDTIGVYHTELVLPDALRYIQVGVVALTVPVFVIDIFTNGDFKLDIGFPWNGNFERSFGVQVLIFTGAAGFYFNKLSGATATNMPVLANGAWGMVLQFGLGLQIGVGRTFRKGPLKAELSISLLGIVEGVIAWFQPSVPGVREDKYYLVKGSVGIVGRLYGEVDLSIITADIEVVARALVAFRFEAYKPIFIRLSVEVSVSVSVKIVFVRISVSFSTTISAEFTLGSAQPTPWQFKPGTTVLGLAASQPAQPRAARRRSRALLLGDDGAPLSWQPRPVPDIGKQVTLYFQPALTRDTGGTLGVALLFIKNSVQAQATRAATLGDGADTVHTSFDDLAEALLEWAVRADSAIDPQAITLADLEALHSLLTGDANTAPALFSLSELSRFLEQNFEFTIAPATADLSGTLFPMPPALTLTLGDGTLVRFDDTAARGLSGTDRQNLAAFFGQLRVSGAAAPAVNGETLSLAQFVFLDYFALLVRGVVQRAAQYVHDNPEQLSSGHTITLQGLRKALDGSGDFNHLAGMASRFLLHGLRLPWPTNALDTTRPLYELTGQQFALSKAKVDATYRMTLGKGDNLGWVRLPGSTDTSDAKAWPFTISESGTPALWRLIQSLGSIDKPADLLPVPAPVPLPAYALAPRRFNLERRSIWQATATILALPDELRFAIGQGNSSNVSLKLGRARDGGELRSEEITNLSSYAYATRVELEVRRIPTPDGAGALPATYQLIGTGEAGKDTLEDLYSYIVSKNAATELHLLYRDVSGGEGVLASGQAVQCFVLKTNLSTESNLRAGVLGVLGDEQSLDTNYSAQLASAAKFIQLVWQCSTVNTGGFYLHYSAGDGNQTAGLPDHIFTDGQSAKLVLLASATGDPARIMQPFQNCVVVSDALPSPDEAAALFAELDELAPAITRTPGTLGFRLTRPRLDAPGDGTSAAAVLANLYHTLSYKIEGDDSFIGSVEGLPVGPADDDPTTTTDDTLWIYERSVPIASFARHKRMDSASGGLPADGNPYAGVGDTATLSFFWQDIYGNRISATPNKVSLPVRYADQLLGVNQWPGVAESYSFLAGADDKLLLRVELAFDQSAYAPGTELPAGAQAGRADAGTAGQPALHGDLNERVSSARATYRQAAYQLHQPDIRFSAHTSLLRTKDASAPEAERAFALDDAQKAALIGFVDAVYRYLDALAASSPLIHTIQAGDNTLARIAALYNLSLGALAEANADLPNIFAPGTQLGPGSYTTVDGDTLNSIASAIVAADPGHNVLVADVARLNTSVALRTSARLVIPGHLSVPQTAPGAFTNQATTLNQLAAALTQQAGGAVSALDVASANVATVGLIKPGVQVPAPFEGLGALTTNQNETLATLVARFAEPLRQAGRDAAAISAEAIALSVADSADLIAADVSVPSPAGGQPALRTQAGDTLTTLVTRLRQQANDAGEDASAVTLPSVIAAASGVPGLLKPGAQVPSPVAGQPAQTVKESDTLLALATRFREPLLARARLAERVSIASVAAQAAEVAGLLQPGALVIVPPAIAAIELELGSRSVLAAELPEQVLFPLTAQIDITRDESLCDDQLAKLLPTVQRVSAYLSPKTTSLAAGASSAQEAASLRAFASDFEAAFAGVRLALGNETPHKRSLNPDDGVRRPLWAVQFGEHGIDYNINESFPFFFSPQPLANTLLSGTVPVESYGDAGLSEEATPTRIEAVDLNVLARDFLAAVEAFLEPQVAVPALQRAPQGVAEVLQHKQALAEAIGRQVTHILAQTDTTDISQRRDTAAEKLRQQLLIDLAEGYDIETLVQYNVDVELHRAPGWQAENAARVVGQPVVYDPDKQLAQTLQELDIRLSSAKIPLTPGAKVGDPAASQLTFFLNTRTPERLRSIALPLMFRTNEIEHDIVNVEGGSEISKYQASSWLSFILPQTGEPVADNPNYIGQVSVPIPLRAYPIPPSLVLQRAEADPDSFERLEQIREWQYTYVYEHIDAAQDTIESSVSYESLPGSERAGGANGLTAGNRPLFEALVRFAAIYPQLLPYLTGADGDAAARAVSDFAQLVGEVASAWGAWRSSAQAVADARQAQYAISEAPNGANKDVTIRWVGAAPPPAELPGLIVPGYRQYTNGANGDAAGTKVYHFAPKTPEEAAGDPVYGESSIPDRVLSVPNLDIIDQQSAWGAIWLSRNKVLLPDRQTNPAFVYQTPQVRFGAIVTPLLVNTRRWQIDQISAGDGAQRTLAQQIDLLFATLLPERASRPYDLRVTVRYAFALATASGDDLLSTLPVLLGPRFTVPDGQVMLDATRVFRGALAQALAAWRTAHRPLETQGEFIFSVAIFSSHSAQDEASTARLPLLQIDDLRLPLASISLG